MYKIMFRWLRILLCLAPTGATKVGIQNENEHKMNNAKIHNTQKESCTQVMRMQPRFINKYAPLSRLFLQIHVQIPRTLQLKNTALLSVTAFSPGMIQSFLFFLKSAFPNVNVTQEQVADFNAGNCYATNKFAPLTAAAHNSVSRVDNALSCGEVASVSSAIPCIDCKPAQGQQQITLPKENSNENYFPSEIEKAATLRREMINESLALSKEIEWEWEQFNQTNDSAILDRIRELRKQNNELAKVIFA